MVYRRIDVDELQPGSELHAPLLAEDGAVLLAPGERIEPVYLKLMSSLGIERAFMGEETELVLVEARKCFGRVKLTRPEASRKGSAEMYLLGLDFRPPCGLSPPL